VLIRETYYIGYVGKQRKPAGIVVVDIERVVELLLQDHREDHPTRIVGFLPHYYCAWCQRDSLCEVVAEVVPKSSASSN
jgi:hypothetical protein